MTSDPCTRARAAFSRPSQTGPPGPQCLPPPAAREAGHETLCPRSLGRSKFYVEKWNYMSKKVKADHIGMKLAKALETFEKYHIVEPAEINFNLRFPVSEVILALEEERPTGKFRFKPKYYKLLETENLFYLSGSILMISNFIAKKDPTIGFSIIAATFIYNQILIDNQ